MARRDPDKTARNRIIQNIKEELRAILPEVLAVTGVKNEQSLNAKIGSKHDDFFDLKNDVIHSHDEFINKWFQGLNEYINNWGSSAYKWIHVNAKRHDVFKRYLLLFLQRSYLTHFDELSKNRPSPEDSEIWIGQNHADYGLLVTPRFKDGDWENDKSEIRAFKQGYWTIGHILETGLVVPGRKRKITFKDIDDYLAFFIATLVRHGLPQDQRTPS